MVLLAAGLLLYLRNSDLSLYQVQVQRFLSDRIGHELQIGGRFELHFGSTTVLIAEDVSLTNTDWHRQAELIRVGHLEFAFDTWSLLSPPFVVVALGARDVQGKLVQDNGLGINWATGRPARANESRVPFDLNRVAFLNVSIENVEFVYESTMRPRPLRAIIERVRVSPDESGILDLDVRGRINDLALLAEGKLGPWRNFIDGRDIFADLDLALGPLTVELDGTVADVLRLEGIELDGNLRGPDIGGVLSRLDIPPFADGVFTLNASVHQQADGHGVQLNGNFGQIEFEASGVVDSLLIPRTSSYSFSIRGPDAQRVSDLLGVDGVPADAFEVSGNARRDGLLIGFDEVVVSIGESSVRLGGIVDAAVMDIDVDLVAAGPDFSVIGPFARIEGLPNEAFDISGRVRKSGRSWEARSVEAQVGDNLLRANGRVEEGGFDTAEIAIEADGPDIAFVEDFLDITGIPSGPYDIDVVLRSHADGIEVREGVGIFGENRIEVQGVLVPEPGFTGTRGIVRAIGPEFQNVALISGVPYLPPGPFNVQGEVKLEDNAIVLSGVTATVGDLEGAADGWAGFGDKVGDFELEVALQGPDISMLPQMEWASRLADEPFRAGGALSRSEDVFMARGLDVSIGNLNARLNGRIARGAGSLEVSIVADADDARVIGKFAELEQVPSGAVAASGSLSLADGQLTFSNAILEIGDYRASANGALHFGPLQNDSDLEFSINGPSLQEGGNLFGIGMLPNKKFRASGHFSGTPTGFDMRDFVVKLGENDLTGEFNANLEGKPSVVGYLSSTHLDISDGLNRPRQADPRAETGEGDNRPRLFSDAPLNTGWLQKANIDVEVRIGELIANALHVNDIDVGIKLRDGSLTLDPIFLRDETGDIEASFSLAPQDGMYHMRSWVEIDDIHFGVLSEDNQDPSTLPLLEGSARIEGQGESIRSIMGSANGEFSLRQGPGRVREIFGSGIFKDVVLQAFRSLNPRRERGFQNVECGFYDATIVDGVLTFDRIAVQTTGMTTVASGRVRLKSERIDMTFRAKPRQGIGVSLGTVANSFLAIGGTLKQPTVSLDPTRSATTTGVAVATGGLSLLARGLWDRVSAEADICKEQQR
jgi:hypothetical protein